MKPIYCRMLNRLNKIKHEEDKLSIGVNRLLKKAKYGKITMKFLHPLNLKK